MDLAISPDLLHAWGVQTFLMLNSIDGYITLGGERIWVKVTKGQIVEAAAPFKWIAGTPETVPPSFHFTIGVAGNLTDTTSTLSPFLDWGGRTQPKP